MRSPLRVLVPLAVIAVIVAAGFVLRRSVQLPVREHASGQPTPAGPGADALTPGADADSGEDVVARALRLAAIDTTHKKEWVEDIPDLELASLSPAARETFLRVANGRHCNCGCGFTLAGCRRFDSECEVSGPRAKALFDSVHAGLLTSAEGFPERPGRESPARLQRPNRRD